MRLLALLAALPWAAQAANIVLSNDDGWAEINIRQFYNVLTAAGNDVVLSAPAENESGTGSSDATPGTLTSAGEFNSIPVGAPGIGFNASNPRLNYVNSYPVTAMRNGIQNVSTKYFSKPDLAVAGFNVGANLGSTTLISGTVGAATEAAKEGVPAIAFSGSTGSQISYTTSPVPNYVAVYANLSLNVTQSLLASKAPYLPSGVYLNVNFPASTSTSCTSASQVKFVLSRVNAAASGAAADVVTCGSSRLPTESSVVGTAGCYASISVGNASSKGDSSTANQAVVLGKLKGILSCLPS